jgi:hypothetical protein
MENEICKYLLKEINDRAAKYYYWKLHRLSDDNFKTKNTSYSLASKIPRLNNDDSYSYGTYDYFTEHYDFNLYDIKYKKSGLSIYLSFTTDFINDTCQVYYVFHKNKKQTDSMSFYISSFEELVEYFSKIDETKLVFYTNKQLKKLNAEAYERGTLVSELIKEKESSKK